jgi:hypothetical protein
MDSYSFKQPLAELYTILLEEHFQVAEDGNLFLTLVSKTDQSGSMMKPTEYQDTAAQTTVEPPPVFKCWNQ